MTRSAIETSWKRHFPTVEPTTIVVHSSMTPSWDHLRNSLNHQHSYLTGQMIPFKEAIQQLLSVKSISEAVLKSFKRNEERLTKDESSIVYEDVWDGELIRKNPVYVKNNGHVLGIQIWHDEVELCNALGSRAGGRSKMALFHWTLMNLPPTLRSNLHSVNLLGIIEASLLKDYGAEVFLESFLRDLKQFENGVTLNLAGTDRKIPCIVTNFVGDLPALNWLGGFKENTSFAYRPCRICLIKRSDLDRFHSSKNCILRNKLSHEQQLKEVTGERDQKFRENASKMYGINDDWAFRVISYADNTKDLSHDLMHLFDEGILNLECRLLLNFLIEEKKIDIDIINRELRKVKCFREFTQPLQLSKEEIISKSRPKNSKKLSLSSTEMHSLSIILPIILAKFIDFRENKHYSNFLLLLEISAFVRCYWFQESDIKILSALITSHNKCFVSLYKKIVVEENSQQDQPTITPKLHALLHLPDQIRRQGPLRYSWSYRYESANVPIKKIMRRNSNYRNVAYTVACFYQKNLARRVANFTDGDFFEMNYDSDPRVFKLKRMQLEHNKFFQLIYENQFFSCGRHDYFTFAAGIKLSGRNCFIGSVFAKEIYHPDQLELPLFWTIAEIIMVGSKPYLVMQLMETLAFQQDSFSFILRPLDEFELIEIASLQPYIVPLHLFEYDEEFHVAPDYYHFF